MTTTLQIKEEFYLQRLFGDDVPEFVDATRYVRDGTPYPLSAGDTLKATCGVRTDDEVVAFSLRRYTARQAEREIERLEKTVGGVTVTRSNVLWPRLPRRTLYELSESARELAAVLGEDDVVVELDGELYVLALTREHCEGVLALTSGLARTDEGYARSETGGGDPEFALPASGLRLRVFLRSPVRRRVIAYEFAGGPAREPGAVETVTRATALALNSGFDLAPFRMLAGLDRIEVPLAPWDAAARPRPAAEPVSFAVPVVLLTAEGSRAARGHVVCDIDLERLNPATGGLGLRLREGNRLEWDPAVAGPARFETYRRALTEAVDEVVGSTLGPDTVRGIACDILVGDVGLDTVAGLRAATARLPVLAATPREAAVCALEL
ncbi:hypothetical protein [Actinomadura algeriensis]|uniref:Uncharacterized protein n=1 Tax=Actinomadura algeriensis TaxID=1679523 RepID=A0ABR9JR30_9ACTN|nr:hypothetical protein [Actinomadura algeriensis]MBE1532874.1 hypothetical protein [Actinomadura algeriensis]